MLLHLPQNIVLKHIHSIAFMQGCYETNEISRKMLKACGFVPNPDGDSHEVHYLTGAPITQHDYVLYKHI